MFLQKALRIFFHFIHKIKKCRFDFHFIEITLKVWLRRYPWTPVPSSNLECAHEVYFTSTLPIAGLGNSLHIDKRYWSFILSQRFSIMPGVKDMPSYCSKICKYSPYYPKIEKILIWLEMTFVLSEALTISLTILVEDTKMSSYIARGFWDVLCISRRFYLHNVRRSVSILQKIFQKIRNWPLRYVVQKLQDTYVSVEV